MRKSKLICELIFIFLLPLVFLSFNISINQDYVYDENGNFKTSGLNVEMNNINFINEVKDVHHGVEYVYYTEDEFNLLDQTVLSNFKFNYFNFINLHDVSGIGTFVYNSLIFYINYIDYSTTSYNANYPVMRSLNTPYVLIRLDYTDYYLSIRSFDDVSLISSFSFDYLPNFWIKEVNQVDESTYKNPIYEVCVQLDHYIGFDSTSTTMQIINAYTTLWVLMFFIWHLLYMFLDFFPHLFERKRE